MMMHRALQRAVATRPASVLSRGFAHNSKEFVGIVGLGQMGGHMANNMLSKGQKLVVFDVDAANTKRVEAMGAIAASSAREVAEKCDTVLTMLPNTAIVEEVYLGEGGFRDVVRPNQFFIDSSTIDAIFTKKLSEIYHTEKKARFVDAPVSGGVIGAENGTLTFMVGGTAEEFEAVKSTLQYMGKNIVHCGASSMGQVAKVCNNLALIIQMASVAEAMNLGVKLGMDPAVLRGIMNTSTSQCWSSSLYHPYPGLMENVPSSNDYKGGFSSALVKKDLGLGVDAGKQASVTLPLTSAMLQMYTMIVNDGYGNKDFSYILQYLKGKN